jgi:hypothetical protein
MATYAVIYSSQSKAIRRVIADDDGLVVIGTLPGTATPAVICNHSGGQPPSYHVLGVGESAIAVIPASAISPDRPINWAAAVQKATGVVPPEITCALIDQSNVVQQVIRADPEVDSAPAGFTMVQCYSPAIGIGCTYDPASGKFWTPESTLPPHTPGNPTDNPVVVPPQEI